MNSIENSSLSGHWTQPPGPNELSYRIRSGPTQLSKLVIVIGNSMQDLDQFRLSDDVIALFRARRRFVPRRSRHARAFARRRQRTAHRRGHGTDWCSWFRLAVAATQCRGVDVTAATVPTAAPVWSSETVRFQHDGAARPTIDDVTVDIARGSMTALWPHRRRQVDATAGPSWHARTDVGCGPARRQARRRLDAARDRSSNRCRSARRNGAAVQRSRDRRHGALSASGSLAARARRG